MNSFYSVKARVFNLLFDTFFSSHFAFLEKIGNKENPDSAQDGGRSTLDGRLSTLFKSHKGGDGVQGGRVSRGGPVAQVHLWRSTSTKMTYQNLCATFYSFNTFRSGVVGRGGSILGDNLSDSDGYGDDRVNHVDGRCFPAFSKMPC